MTDKPVKVHKMPVELWFDARTQAMRLGITISQYVINALREAVERNGK